MTRTLKNRNEVIDELTKVLIDAQMPGQPYQQDVYLDVCDGIGEISLFDNVGGHSERGFSYWLTSIPEDDEDIFTITDCCDADDIARQIGLEGVTAETLLAEMKAADDTWKDDMDYDINRAVIDYVKTREDYIDAMYDSYRAWLESDCAGEASDEAERLIAEWENNEDEDED